jgi:hypothetical protein
MIVNNLQNHHILAGVFHRNSKAISVSLLSTPKAGDDESSHRVHDCGYCGAESRMISVFQYEKLYVSHQLLPSTSSPSRWPMMMKDPSLLTAVLMPLIHREEVHRSVRQFYNNQQNAVDELMSIDTEQKNWSRRKEISKLDLYINPATRCATTSERTHRSMLHRSELDGFRYSRFDVEHGLDKIKA